MFYGLENGTSRDDKCSMCDDRLQPTKWKMSQAAFLLLPKRRSATLAARCRYGDSLGGFTFIFLGKTTLPALGAGLAPPLSADIWQRRVYMQNAAEVSGAVVRLLAAPLSPKFLCRSRKYVSSRFHTSTHAQSLLSRHSKSCIDRFWSANRSTPTFFNGGGGTDSVNTRVRVMVSELQGGVCA